MTKEQVKGAPPTHLKILEADEIETLYGFPVFDDEDRVFYFALAPPEQIILSQLRGTKSRIYYILQLGYFKARQQFFTFDLQQVAADAHYVQRTYYPDFELTDLDINKTTRRKQRQFILEVLQYRYCGDEEQKQLYAKAQQVVRISSRPVYVFRELIAYLTRQRLVSPGYTVMQRMVGNVLQKEKARLTATAEAHLTSDHVTSLNDLLDNPNGLYEITKLKHEPKDFSNAEINQEIKRGEQIKSLYAVARDILPHLGISNESIKYYASLINYYSVFQMNQLEESPAHIYLLCFIYHRYQKLHDNLINCLIYRVRKLIDEARSIAKDRVYDYHQAHKNNLHKAGQVLKLFMDDTIAASTPFGDVQKKAFAIIRRQELAQVTNHILQTAQLDETQFGWEYLDQVAQRFKVGIRPILRAIDFEATSANKDLITAVHFLKTAFNKNKALTQYKGDNIPQAFISGTHKRYLYIPTDEGEKQLLVDRYEFLVYRLLRDNLEAGDVFCRDSVHFRSFEDDLLSDVQWQQKEALIARTGLPILNQKVEAHLADLKDALETQLEQVNQRIMAGENEHINIKKQGRWSLPYSSAGEQVNAPFFEVLPQFDIQAVIHFVNRYCPFLAEFTHVLHRNAGRHPDYHTLVACLLAWGTNMGLGRMGQISDVGYQKLVTTSNNFIRLETLQKANDTLSNAIAQLPIFQHHHIDDTVHSSSDGQKFETRIHTINARFSPKYFGLMKGIVAYTMVANHIPINTRIIGANEHESHYVFDILFNNLTDIKPTIHSTDTHGTNEVNFGILHFFGYDFAPRYRDIHDVVKNNLYGFQHPTQYDQSWLLRPIRKINEQLIIDEWENIQRIIVSLALKTSTQSIIISKLSSYARRNKTKRALWEYDNIIHSLYLLRYVDIVALRRNVQQALNRVESYHKLHRAVSFANFGKLHFRTQAEQQIWNECGRLIAHCIIFYNAMILSNVLRYQAEMGLSSTPVSLEKVSPVAWQHINLYGRYVFTETLQAIDLDTMVRDLMTHNHAHQL